MLGQTASAGFQIGVRRTFPISQEQAWALLISPVGLKLCLGDISDLKLEVGHPYTTKEGIFGELRVVKPLHQLRMTWQRKTWESPSTVQIRIIPNPKSAGKTVISFHQEKLKDANERENMKRYWEEAAAKILGKINADM
ncbi:SRPBCC domain-containing protein [Paenibacillus sp. FJAT-27812]|uniref:SRPBCC domain-containing protein n=1 Tax=Paenibacillus sp. FJAT-27812 TaxID=1684143 RepID=UPI0006A7E0C2|nr:SRPBCC domain-containing protein [Paenibacillus sp. FJAT-27812]